MTTQSNRDPGKREEKSVGIFLQTQKFSFTANKYLIVQPDGLNPTTLWPKKEGVDLDPPETDDVIIAVKMASSIFILRTT